LRQRLPGAVPADLQALYTAIWRGSYPALVAQPSMSRDLFYSSYLQTYLQRDVRDLARVGDQSAFLRLLRAAAARTAQLLNMAELARDADVAPNTAKSWLAVLEASGVVSLLQPWHTNLSKRLVKTPKLHFLDTGLAAYLTQWSSPETLQAGAMGGAIFESWVYGEILRSHSHAASTAPMYYFRDKDQREVDLLIEADGLLHPVECKRSASPGRDVLAGMRALANAGARVGPGAVVCMVAEPVPLQAQPRVTALPAWVL
jgi:predicted AAA+ superfamily ATPase